MVQPVTSFAKTARRYLAAPADGERVWSKSMDGRARIDADLDMDLGGFDDPVGGSLDGEVKNSIRGSSLDGSETFDMGESRDDASPRT